ncbi:MAG: hypothetical protein ACWA5Q_06450 [bacterium]
MDIFSEVVGTLKWKDIECDGGPKSMYRAKIPGGWLLSVRGYDDKEGGGLTFIPDPNHEWDGNSID